MRIVFVGGGTGGHFYPLIAVAEWLTLHAKEGGGAMPELYYMGPDRYDEKELAALNISFLSCPAGKRRRYRSLKNIIGIFATLYGVLIALYKLYIVYPDVVMSKGGFTSVPVVSAAWILRIPIVIHESDATPGTANRFAARFARYIGISYTAAAQFFPDEKTALTGIPVRSALLSPLRENPHEVFGTEKGRHIILVLGGSQGAERVNELILESLDELLPHYNVLHQTGPRSFETVSASAKALITDSSLLTYYHPLSFLSVDDLNTALHGASLIVSRAGSGAIHEIALHGKPSILIPIPEDVSHDQRTNAYAYARTGAATVLEEENLKDGLLEAEITRIMNDQQIYRNMQEAALSFAKRDGAQILSTALLQIGREHE